MTTMKYDSLSPPLSIDPTYVAAAYADGRKIHNIIISVEWKQHCLIAAATAA